jgi:hypothetical protein
MHKHCCVNCPARSTQRRNVLLAHRAVRNLPLRQPRTPALRATPPISVRASSPPPAALRRQPPFKLEVDRQQARHRRDQTAQTRCQAPTSLVRAVVGRHNPELNLG